MGKQCCVCVFVIVCLISSVTECFASQILLYSLFSWGGLRGNVTFSWGGHGTDVMVEVGMEYAGIEEPLEPKEFDWGIYEMPIRFDIPNRCDKSRMGKRLIDFSTILGKLVMPMSANQEFLTTQIPLVGDSSIWGRSILISAGSQATCGNIQGVGGEVTYEARFHSPIGGSIWFRTWSWDVTEGAAQKNDTSGTEIIILSDVFNTLEDEPKSTSHDWNLYITDILDDVSAEYRVTCNFLTNVFDRSLKSSCDESGCPEGDFTSKHGKLQVSAAKSKLSQKIFHSSGRPLPSVSGARQLYIGIEDITLRNNVYACARLRTIKPKRVKAFFSSGGVSGEISVEQTSVFSPTELTLDLHNLQEEAGGFHVHEVPVERPIHPAHSHCSDTGGHFNPYKVAVEDSPPPGTGSHDKYELGDLSGKHGMLLGVNSVSATVIDHNLPLTGPRSIVGRSIVIHKADGSRWICANLRQDVELLRAVATFRYPLVGEIIMEQEANDPLADTTITVGPLLYSDGSHNDTSLHEWYVNRDIPGRDFFNWTARCASAGPRFNPYKISIHENIYRSCGSDNAERCEVGDLHKRTGTLNIAGSTGSATKTRKVFTDSNLPLSGPKTVIQHAIVIEDKNGPRHRGVRLGCTGIFRRFRYKGVVNQWFSSDKDSKVEGKLEFIQESPYDITNTEVDISGLQSIASGYHVHMVPVLNDLAFPCAAATLYGHFNPLNISMGTSPPPAEGTDDQYEIGDLSGKYGTLDRKTSLQGFYNDSNLPLFGTNSILGRSVLIHKKDQSERWFCGSIVWGYAPSEARQVAAIASFHHPKGFAWGYVRLRQLVYNDGSLSETSIEVNLRHPGTNNKNVTRGHNWSVYVNPVGVDAAVKFFQSRCVASGYRWNPFLIQLAQPNDHDYYDKQCTPEYPLRCDAGDISGRLGTIDLGDKRFVFLDKNLPLSGKHSAMGKALVVHNEQGRVERFACANIQPDEDIVKWANIRRTSKFSATEFMDDMRKMLSAPEWFLAIDQQSVKLSTDGQCITFRIFFLGPYAHQLEQDFTRLLSGGILEKPTISTPGEYPDPNRDTKVSYRSCGGLDAEDVKKKTEKRQWWNFGDFGLISSSSKKDSTTWLFVTLGLIVISMAK